MLDWVVAQVAGRHFLVFTVTASELFEIAKHAHDFVDHLVVVLVPTLVVAAEWILEIVDQALIAVAARIAIADGPLILRYPRSLVPVHVCIEELWQVAISD